MIIGWSQKKQEEKPMLLEFESKRFKPCVVSPVQSWVLFRRFSPNFSLVFIRALSEAKECNHPGNDWNPEPRMISVPVVYQELVV